VGTFGDSAASGSRLSVLIRIAIRCDGIFQGVINNEAIIFVFSDIFVLFDTFCICKYST
jgi:hypothetical protein